MKPIRPSMSKARRLRLFLLYEGVCYLSGRKIGPEDEWQVEHVIPWALSFNDADENLRLVLTEPHLEKTKADVKRIAKAKRQSLESGQQARRAKNGPTMKSRPFPKGSRKLESRPFEKRKR